MSARTTTTDPTLVPSARWILVATIVASGMVFLDGTIVNVALPRIAQDLPTTVLGRLEAQTYITSGYLAVLAAFLVLAGALADKYGRRRIFLIGLAGFGVTSVMCGLAPSMEVLVLARLLQGFAGALLVPGSLSIITSSFEGAARARAFGVWAAATSALTVLGPLVGGILVDTISWRMAFLVNIPFALLGLYAAWRHVPESRDPNAPRRLDWLGSVVIALAVGGISFGIVRGQETGWSDPASLVALGVGIVAALLFPVLMVVRRDPLVPPKLFRRREFTVINLSTFLIYSALYVTQFLQSVFLQGVLGYTALASALIGSLPAGLILTFGSTRVGTIAGRVGVWPFLVAGPIAHGRGSALARAHPVEQHALGCRRERSVDVVAPDGDAHRRPAVRAALRCGHHARGRPPHDRAHGLDPGRERGHRLGDQQRDLARRSAARARDPVRHHLGHVLRLARERRPRPRRHVSGGPGTGPTPQPGR